MIGAGKPDSRSCPVVLDPTVAASFAGLIGGALGANAVQRGRSPFADRLGEELASEACVLHDDGRDPEGPASAPFDGEGVPRRRTALIEGGRLRAFLYDTYTANRGDGASTGTAARSGYRSQPSVSASNLVVAPGALALAELLGEAGDGVYVTDVAGLHSGVNPVTGVFSVGASGRLIRGGELAEPVREFTIAGDLVSMLGAVRAAGAESRWVPFGGSVKTPPLLIGEMADQRFVTLPRAVLLTPSPLLDCARSSTPRRILDVTKAEFLDQLAGDDRLGSKKAASDAVDAVLDAITAALSCGDEVSFTGFGKFHVAERGPRQGVNPRTGERITIPGGKVPRFSAGSALKTKVKGG